MVSPGQGGDITMRRVGAHKVTVGAKNTGFTRGNLALTVTADKRAVNVAEYGTTDADFEVTGVHVKVTWNMIERSLKTLDIALQGVYPSSYLSATTTRGIGRSGIRTGQSLTGQGSETGRGQVITLHPISRTGGDTAQDITLYKAMVTPTGAWELSDQGDMVIEVQADCLIDPTQTDGNLLCLINEPNAGV